MFSKDAKIYIAGHCGMAGSAILRKLKENGYHNFVFRTPKELDLRIQRDTKEFFQCEKQK